MKILKRMTSILLSSFLLLLVCPTLPAFGEGVDNGGVPETDAVVAVAEPVNVALGKSYAISGNGKGYRITADRSQWGDAIYDANLTDGVTADEIEYGVANKWFGLYWNPLDPATYDLINAPKSVGSITLDLEDEVASLVSARIHVCTPDNEASVCVPYRVTLSLSNDGVNFARIGDFNGIVTAEDPYWVSLTFDKAYTARYAKVTFEFDGVFVFLDEIEVYQDSAKETNELSSDPADYDDFNLLWLTHYNEYSEQGAEGAGVIFTETDNAGDYWHHVAFAPVDAERGIYQIADISFGDNGEAERLSIPEGGFVYGINVGNDWPALVEEYGATGDGSTGQWWDDETHINYPNYRTESSILMYYTVEYCWSVGDRFAFRGLDLANKTLPTTTPDIKWYDFGYVCTAGYTPFYGEIEPEYKLGDINGDGEITTVDYIMAKRAVIGTYNLNETQKLSADVNNSGGIDAVDYIMIKRHVIGTYTIK